jgi:TolA-binding protein
MATGRKPFEGETITETMTQIIRDEPMDAAAVNPGVSPGLKAIIDRSLRKNPGERYTAAELVTALDAQMGRAGTLPYTSPQSAASTMVVTAAPTASVAPTIRTGPQVQTADPTIRTGPQAQTVQEAAARQPATKPKGRGALAAVVVVMVIILAAVAGLWATRRSEPKVTASQSAVPPQTSAPQSSTAVNVTAPSDATVDETTSDAANTTTTAKQVGKTSTTPPTDTAEETPTAAEPTTSTAEPESAPGADALYAIAMKQAQDGDPMEARKTLHRVLQQDPHYAKAHFRMGEIALLNRNLDYASKELQRALDDTDRLGPRVEQLTHLGMALATRDKREVERLSDEFSQRWPNDPDLERMRTTFPGMFGEIRRDVRQPDRGRARRWQRP